MALPKGTPLTQLPPALGVKQETCAANGKTVGTVDGSERGLCQVAQWLTSTAAASGVRTLSQRALKSDDTPTKRRPPAPQLGSRFSQVGFARPMAEVR